MRQTYYAGVENEFQLIGYDGNVFGGSKFQAALKKYSKPVIRRYDTAIRTAHGGAIYLDGDEPEVCTPPSRIRPGCVSEIADNLYNVRKDLLEIISADDSLRLIGYSTHWNITNTLVDTTFSEVMKHMVVPYSLFTLNPLSSGINMRQKPSRVELLGDYIDDIDQVKALLLLYLGTINGLKENITNIPLRVGIVPDDDDAMYTNPVLDGRYTDIPVCIGEEFKTIKAQSYLEIYYKLFRDAIKNIGTSEEVINLEDFIYGRKSLEIDKFKKYAVAHNYKEDELAFKPNPLMTINPEDYAIDKPISGAHATFLGSLATHTYDDREIIKNNPRLSVKDIEWYSVRLNNGLDSLSFRSIDNIDITAEVLAKIPIGEKNELFNDVMIIASYNNGLLYQYISRDTDNEGYVFGNWIHDGGCIRISKNHNIICDTDDDKLKLTSLGQIIKDVIINHHYEIPKHEIPRIYIKKKLSALEAKVQAYNPDADTSYDDYTSYLRKELLKTKKEDAWKNIWCDRDRISVKNILKYGVRAAFYGFFIGALFNTIGNCAYSPAYKPIDTQVNSNAVVDTLHTSQELSKTNDIYDIISANRIILTGEHQ